MQKIYTWVSFATAVLFLLSGCSAGNNSTNSQAVGTATQSASVTPDLAATAVTLKTQVAEDTETPVPTATPIPPALETSQIPDTGRVLPVRLTRLLNFDVYDLQDEDLGSVNDFVLDLSKEQVTYLFVDTSGIFELDQEIIPLPWETLDFNVVPADQLLLQGENSLYAGIDRGKIESAPAIDLENLPDFMNPYWDQSLRDYWQTTNVSTATQTVPSPTSTKPAVEASPQRSVFLAQNFLNYSINNQKGEQLGAVEDVILGFRSGEIIYIMVSSGGLLGIGEKWIPVPPDLLRAGSQDGELIFLGTVKDLMEAPNYDLNQLPETNLPGWDDAIVNYWQGIHIE